MIFGTSENKNKAESDFQNIIVCIGFFQEKNCIKN